MSGELEARPWTITGSAHGPGPLLSMHFLSVGGNKTAANVSSKKGNLCWCHGQGITSAYSYRIYHLQRIPSTTYSKNQKKSIKWLAKFDLYFSFIFFFLLWFFTKVHFDMPLKENPMCMSNRFRKKEKKKLIYRTTQRIRFGRSNQILCSGSL